MAATNLPAQPIEDSAAATKLYFENYGGVELEFPANDVTVAVNFFTAAGFALDAAATSAAVLLRQAKIDGTPIAQILDTMKEFPGVTLSQIVAEILNANRVSTSLLGFRTVTVNTNRSRDIAA